MAPPHVDAVEIDPVIMRLGLAHHPDRPYSDPRVTRINDDARHFLRTTDKKYDLVVFALIDSLTMQSSFSGVRLESYMFTEESFRAVRDRLAPNGLLVVYNYFREPWLVDRLANIAAAAFNSEPRVHVHEARAYLGVMLAGPRLTTLTTDPVVPERVTAFNQSHEPSPARGHRRDASVEPATDDWPFLYLENRHIPAHYLGALALILVVSIVAVMATLRGQAGRWSWEMFLLGAAFMLLETKSIIQFALLWGSTWFVASLVIAAVLTMAILATVVVSRVEIRRPWLVCAVLVGLLAVNYVLPVGSIGFSNRGRRVALLCARSSSARSSAPACCSDRRSNARRRCRATTARTSWARWWEVLASTCRWSPDSARCSRSSRCATSRRWRSEGGDVIEICNLQIDDIEIGDCDCDET